MIKKYVASKDATITNAYKYNSAAVRATGSNIGAADSGQVFSLFGNTYTGSIEKSRMLLQFPIANIITDRTTGLVPASGSVSFYLKLFNVKHTETLPRDFIMNVSPISASVDWEEGQGLDLDDYTDLGRGFGGQGVTWATFASSSVGALSWSVGGGDTFSDLLFSQSFLEGYEDLSIDISPLVEEWIDSTKDNRGVLLYLTSSQENNSSSISYYTKRFSMRKSEFFFSRPVIEAIWDDSKKDNRGNFYPSSSFIPASDNLNTIYFYNYVRGQLTNLAGLTDDIMYVRTYESSSNGTELTTALSSPITGGLTSDVGIYTASLAVETSGTMSVMFDRWYSATTGSSTNCAHTGTIILEDWNASNIATLNGHTIKLTNLKNKYSTREESARLRLFTRNKCWNPSIYLAAVNEAPLDIIDNIYYRVIRSADSKEVIGYGTGSLNQTRLSYDASGSYFDFDMGFLEDNYGYEFRFALYENGNYTENPYIAKFRVED
jgi:hypothetical protein